MSHGGDQGRWLVSYADFITLLMVMFVVLWSMSQIDLARYRQLSDSFKLAFGTGSGGKALNVVDPQIDRSAGAIKDGKPNPISLQDMPQAPSDSVQVAGELTDMLSSTNLGSSVSVQNNIEGVLISLGEKIVFQPGTANLTPESYEVLDAIIPMIAGIENDVRVVGHTDDTPPGDPAFKSNWELSVGRAMTIVQYFQSKGIQPERLTASGRGEFQPIVPNDTPEHRTLNNRAEIMIIFVVENDLANTSVSPLIPEVGSSTP